MVKRQPKFIIEGKTAVIPCTDPRIARQVLVYMRRLIGRDSFAITPPGGAKFLVSCPDDLSDHDLLKFYYKHGVRTVFSFVHDKECAVYDKLLWEFQGISEINFLNRELAIGKERYEAGFPGTRVYPCRLQLNKRDKIANYNWL